MHLSMSNEPGPLSGLRVIELAGLGPGPFAAMQLADMGADVVRVDRPGGIGFRVGSEHLDILNRGKRSVVLDLKDPAAVDLLLRMMEKADVLIEGNRPGVVERLGIGPDVALTRNPRLVYARMTGWGQEGPLSRSAGHDLSYIALTGALDAIGSAGGPPQVPLNLVGDFGGGGMYLVAGILAALHHASRTGEGQVVDAAIVDGTINLLASTYNTVATGGWSEQRGTNLLDGGAPFYSVYPTSDGHYMAVAALEPQFYAGLLKILDLGLDPAKQNDRSTWPALRAALSDAFASRTREEWVAAFDGRDACVAPVLTLVESRTNPHLAARGAVVEIDGLVQPAPAPRFSRTPSRIGGAPPRSGHDHDEVLTDWGID